MVPLWHRIVNGDSDKMSDKLSVKLSVKILKSSEKIVANFGKLFLSFRGKTRIFLVI